MEEQEKITPECEEIKKEYEIKKNNKTLRIKMNNSEIIFILIIGVSYFKYIRNYKYNEIIKELNIFQCKNINGVYDFLIKCEYKIITEEKIKKILINNKEIKLNEKILTNQELIKILIDKMKN